MSNRKVSTDALETLGTIIGEGEKRDAIHLAVLPVVAGEALRPAAWIRLVNGKAVEAEDNEATGIVDPFLSEGPEMGQRFWMVLMPRTVTSLRHVWSRPAFPDDADTAPLVKANRDASEKWLRAFCDNADVPGYDETIAAVLHGRNRGEVRFGDDASGEIPDEFWDHVEVVTGQKFTTRAQWFSCSC